LQPDSAAPEHSAENQRQASDDRDHRRRLDDATATLMVAVVRGLLLDRLTTGDRVRTDAALRRFAELL
jgi:hypothetical protein